MTSKEIQQIKNRFDELRNATIAEALNAGVDVESVGFKRKIKDLERKVLEKLNINAEEYKNIEIILKAEEGDLSLEQKISDIELKIDDKNEEINLIGKNVISTREELKKEFDKKIGEIKHEELKGIKSDDHHAEKHTLESHKESELMKQLLELLKSPKGSGKQYKHGGGASVFTQLLDVPISYTGQAGKYVRVKNTEDGLEFSLGSGTGYNKIFLTTDWVSNGSNYELTITHNLDSVYPIVEIKDSAKLVFVNEVEIIDNNSIKLSIPANPDLRFAGAIAINSS